MILGNGFGMDRKSMVCNDMSFFLWAHRNNFGQVCAVLGNPRLNPHLQVGGFPCFFDTEASAGLVHGKTRHS